MNSNPTISVLMPMYNAEAYLGLAIESILNQSYQDFELVILNDGSTDKSLEIALSYQDKRIRVLENEGNLGLTRTRNRLFAEAKGKYVAWLDSDDIAHSARLEKQLTFLQKHTDYAFVASWARIIDGYGNATGGFLKSYFHDSNLPSLLLFVNYVVQSSVLMQKDLFPQEPYKLEFPPTEDYELWSNVVENHPIAILPEVLVDYRVHATNISFTQNERATQTVKLNHKNQLARLGIAATSEEMELHYQIGFGDVREINEAFLVNAEAWLQKLKKYNTEQKIYDSKAFAYVIAHRWTKICTSNLNLGLKGLKILLKSDLSSLTLQNVALLLKYVSQIISK